MSHPLTRVNFSRSWHQLAVVLLAFSIFLVGVSRAPVPTVDGAVRAVMARTLVEQGHSWPITYEGRVFHDHPPLFVWLTALSIKVFGTTDFAVNLVPRLFAFLTVLVVSATALEAGLTPGTALLSVIILCATRDFVLSSVRGYIEPLLEFFIYLGLWFTLYQKRKRKLWAAASAGAAVWFAAFSKGPVALWPLLFYAFLIFWNGQTVKRRFLSLAAYFGAFAFLTAIWAAWVEHGGAWEDWRAYLFKQVLNSALEGRDGAQSFEPWYFVKILAQYYWPWLPLLLWAIYRSLRGVLELDFSTRASYSFTFGIFGIGFVAAFSLMHWKFWYYIAPAYPAFALFIATHIIRQNWVNKRAFPRVVVAVCSVWILLNHVFPIMLHRERVPEVMAFKDAIHHSDLPGPVWFVRNPMDHNMIGTSGAWYFVHPNPNNQPVYPLVDKVVDESSWLRNQLHAPAWIIMGTDAWQSCQDLWCKKSLKIEQAGKSVLLYYHG